MEGEILSEEVYNKVHGSSKVITRVISFRACVRFEMKDHKGDIETDHKVVRTIEFIDVTQLFQKVLYTAGDMERCLVGLERFDIMYVFRHQ